MTIIKNQLYYPVGFLSHSSGDYSHTLSRYVCQFRPA
nr:MAG TPA: hypothetical protein [Caudoviricetes sp.]